MLVHPKTHLTDAVFCNVLLDSAAKHPRLKDGHMTDTCWHTTSGDYLCCSFVVWLSVLCPRLWEWLAFSASGWQRANRNRSWYGDPRVDRRNEWFFWSTQVDNYLCVSCVRLPHKLLKQWFCKSCSQSGLKWKAPFRNHFWDSLSLSMFSDFIILLLFWNG